MPKKKKQKKDNLVKDASCKAEPPWRTSTVVKLCDDMRASRDFSAAPVLADALEEAGYPDSAVLEKLRKNYIADSDAWRIMAHISSDESAASMRWIAEFADRINQGVKQLMDGAAMWDESEEYTFSGSNETYSSYHDQFPEFWEHYKVVTGRKAKNPTLFFSCSC